MDLFINSILQDKVVKFFTQCILNKRLSHAYIFYGNRGCGKEAFSIELAKALNCSHEQKRPCQECSSCKKITKFQHPDVKFIFPLSKQLTSDEISGLLKSKSENPFLDLSVSGFRNIAIEAIRELKSEAKYAPFEANKRVFIISGAEFFSREAANSFLKLLEEPPEDLLIILTTNDLNALLDTIRSRCQPVHFSRFSDIQIKEIINRYQKTDQDLLPLIRIAQNDIKRVFEILQEDLEERRQSVYTFFQAIASSNYYKIFNILDNLTASKNRNHIFEFLELLILWLRDALHVNYLGQDTEYINQDYSEIITKFSGLYQKIDYHKLIHKIEKTRQNIEQNAHAGIALTALAIDLKLLLSKTTPELEANAS
jgi:DNA polymerase-3 subunit delta'